MWIYPPAAPQMHSSSQPLLIFIFKSSFSSGHHRGCGASTFIATRTNLNTLITTTSILTVKHHHVITLYVVEIHLLISCCVNSAEKGRHTMSVLKIYISLKMHLHYLHLCLEGHSTRLNYWTVKKYFCHSYTRLNQGCTREWYLISLTWAITVNSQLYLHTGK